MLHDPLMTDNCLYWRSLNLSTANGPRRTSRKWKAIDQNFLEQQFPYAPPTTHEEFQVLTCGYTIEDEKRLAAIENLVTHLLIPSFQGGVIPCSPLELPEPWHFAKLLDPAFGRRLISLCQLLIEKNDPRTWKGPPNIEMALFFPFTLWGKRIAHEVFSSVPANSPLRWLGDIENSPFAFVELVS